MFLPCSLAKPPHPSNVAAGLHRRGQSSSLPSERAPGHFGPNLIGCSGLFLLAGEKRRPPSSTLRAQRRAELLVDADSQSVELVRAAMERLQEEGLAVRTSIFAAPDLSKNKKWNALFSEPGVDFHGVARNASAIGEANDIAIRSKCKELMRSKHSERLALLAADLDFLGTLQRLARCGIQVMLFVLSNNYALIHKYRAAGIPVVELASPNERVSRVRATVHPNGSGQVALADPYYLQDCLEEVELCHAFLQDLGYVQAGSHEYLIHAACKFWRRNRLGQLTVFPQQCAIKEVCRVASEHGYRKWLKFAEDSALLIPIYSRSRLTKKQLSTYGSGLARQVFRGGGPFMLKDSKGIVHVALRKLGYLDDELSADLAEAMLAFVNAPENHYALRKKLDLLPVIDDTAMDTEEKLRQAFMSHLSAGRWRIAPRDTEVRHRLRSQGFLASEKAEARDVFEAMAKYARLHGLPRMNSYVGYVFRILRAAGSHQPASTGTVEFDLSGQVGQTTH